MPTLSITTHAQTDHCNAPPASVAPTEPTHTTSGSDRDGHSFKWDLSQFLQSYLRPWPVWARQVKEKFRQTEDVLQELSVPEMKDGVNFNGQGAWVEDLQ